MLKKLLPLFFVTTLITPCWAAKTAELGDTVLVEYTGKLKTGAIFDTNVGNVGKEDLKFTLGEGHMLKDFEDAFIGMSKGETKTIEIPAANAYGEFNEKQVVRTETAKLPEGAKVGDELTLKTTQGYFPVRVVLIDGDLAFIDGNHKLAGQDLSFEVKLNDIIKSQD